MRWQTAKIALVAPAERSACEFAPDEVVWHLSLDQIESQTGRVLHKNRAPASAGGVSTYIFDEGHVLYSKLRPYLNKVVRPDEPGIGTTELVPLRPRQGLLEPAFLKFYLRSDRFVGFATHLVAGAKMPRMIMDKFWIHEMPLPALKEQRWIVELLEQADGLRRQRVEADTLAQRILPALFRHFFGEPTTNPKSWPTSPLHKLADFISGATPSKDNPEFWDGAIPWVSPKDMKRPELHDAIDHVSEKALADTNLKLIPANTALIVVRGMILAHTVPVCLARVPVTINQDMKALSAKGDTTAEFLQWALLTQHSVLLRLVTTAAHGTKKLDTDALRMLAIPIPPPNRKDLIPKWTRIVREQQAAARQRADCGGAVERLWRVMLHRAFTGELTAKWREAHLKELLTEMEHQARLLGIKSTESVDQLVKP